MVLKTTDLIIPLSDFPNSFLFLQCKSPSCFSMVFCSYYPLALTDVLLNFNEKCTVSPKRQVFLWFLRRTFLILSVFIVFRRIPCFNIWCLIDTVPRISSWQFVDIDCLLLIRRFLFFPKLLVRLIVLRLYLCRAGQLSCHLTIWRSCKLMLVQFFLKKSNLFCLVCRFFENKKTL